MAGDLMKAHDFKDYVRTAEYHCLQLERALSDAAERAPDQERRQFATRQVESLKQLRRALPAMRGPVLVPINGGKSATR